MRKLSALLAAVFLLALTAGPLAAWWGAFDYLEFAKTEALARYHPTAKADDAVLAEYQTPPVEAGAGVTTARVRLYYRGWLKRNTMLVDISLMESGRGRLVKTRLVSDTNFFASASKDESGWNRLADIKFERLRLRLSKLGWKLWLLRLVGGGGRG